MKKINAILTVESLVTGRKAYKGELSSMVERFKKMNNGVNTFCELYLCTDQYESLPRIFVNNNVIEVNGRRLNAGSVIAIENLCPDDVAFWGEYYMLYQSRTCIVDDKLMSYAYSGVANYVVITHIAR